MRCSLGKAETDDRKVDLAGHVFWRYEVQYRWGVLYSLRYIDVPQSLQLEYGQQTSNNGAL